MTMLVGVRDSGARKSSLLATAAVAVVCVGAWLTSGSAIAADATPAVNENFGDVESAIAELRQEAGKDRRAIVKANMLLTESESKSFWPLYDEYRAERTQLGDRKVKLITDYLQKRESMSEDDAAALTKEYLAIENQKNETREKWVKKMSKTLSSRTVARFFQIDQKLDAVVDVILAAKIPLVH